MAGLLTVFEMCDYLAAFFHNRFNRCLGEYGVVQNELERVCCAADVTYVSMSHGADHVSSIISQPT